MAKKKQTLTQRRQVIGTLLILLALIQIINFAMHGFTKPPLFYYTPEHFIAKGWAGVVLADLNFPFKYFNYILYRVLGWAGLLTPFLFCLLGYSFFQRKTPSLKRRRSMLLWGLGELMLFLYVINYVFSIILPKNVQPGLLANIFSRYLQRVGGVFFLVLFFAWSLIAFLIYVRKSSWKKFFASTKKSLRALFHGIVQGFANLFGGKKGTGKSTTRKQKALPPKQTPKKIEDKSGSDPTKTRAKAEQPKAEDDVVAVDAGEAIDAEYTVSQINQFDSTSQGSSFPPDALKQTEKVPVDQAEIDDLSATIREVFGSFGINLNQTGLTSGPQLLRFEYEIPSGMQLKQVEKYKEDLSHRIGGLPVTIQAPIQDKSNCFGISVPRRQPDLLGLGSWVEQLPDRAESVPLLLGISAEGEGVWADAAEFPHLLIAGSTGSGKSVFLNSLVLGLMYLSPHVPLNLILIDPKRVEFSPFKKLSLLAAPIVTEVAEARDLLSDLERVMDERYETLGQAGVRNIKEYNAQQGHEPMPYLFVIIDEFSDMILQDPGKTIKNAIVRLAQKARAVGIHNIIATQRPSADVIDGLIKANFPSRIAFRTSSQTDSRIILDENGAENLLGKGDMIYKAGGSEKYRLQGIYVSLEEIKRVKQ